MHMACEKVFEVDTVLTADTVEWCPRDNLHQVLAGGTYQLDEEAGVRRGQLSLYEWNQSSLVQILQSESKKITNGILDVKWNAQARLALALSSGVVTFLQLDKKSGEHSLIEKGNCCVAEQDGATVICLSLDWSKYSSDQSLVAVSDSGGYLSLVDLCQSGPRLIKRWRAHQFEAWIVSCGVSDQHTVYSGGDDCRLCQWDTREGSLTKPTFTSKRHTMGVCSLQIHPNFPHYLTSGSYDENIYIWDTRNMQEPLKELNVGGGVWRVKWCPTNPDLLAAACMHNGFHIVHGNVKTGDPLKAVASYSEHKSLAYGVDWCQQTPVSENQLTLASCSFYDHSLHVWRTNLQ